MKLTATILTVSFFFFAGCDLMLDWDCVSDPATGLCWEDEPVPWADDWEAAKSYCDNLNLAGNDDWRLPDISEYMDILNGNSCNSSPVCTDLFGSDINLYYAVGETTSGGTRWIVNFGNGSIYPVENEYYYPNESESLHLVRCVRKQ